MLIMPDNKGMFHFQKKLHKKNISLFVVQSKLYRPIMISRLTVTLMDRELIQVREEDTLASAYSRFKARFSMITKLAPKNIQMYFISVLCLSLQKGMK